VRWSTLKPPPGGPPVDATDFDYVSDPIQGKAILKIVKDSEILAHGIVEKVESLTKHVLVRRLIRVRGNEDAAGVQKWRVKAARQTPLPLKRVSWKSLLDSVVASKVIKEGSRVFVAPRMPQILQVRLSLSV
jgi:hypothetical protein